MDLCPVYGWIPIERSHKRRPSETRAPEGSKCQAFSLSYLQLKKCCLLLRNNYFQYHQSKSKGLSFFCQRRTFFSLEDIFLCVDLAIKFDSDILGEKCVRQYHSMHLSWINMRRKTTKPTLKNIHFETAKVFNYKFTYTVLTISLSFSSLKYKVFSRSDQTDFFSELRKYPYCLYSFSWLFSLGGGKKTTQLFVIFLKKGNNFLSSPPATQKKSLMPRK